MSAPTPLPAGAPRRSVEFCGYCAARPADRAVDGSRVCPECSMGLLVQAPADVVPAADEPFVLVDDVLAVRGVSRRAERVLKLQETTAVDRPIADLFEAVDGSAAGGADLAAALAGATRGGRTTEIVLRPRGIYGVRWWARVGPCAPGPAAVVVLAERL